MKDAWLALCDWSELWRKGIICQNHTTLAMLVEMFILVNYDRFTDSCDTGNKM